jgi:hypothetical protein
VELITMSNQHGQAPANRDHLTRRNGSEPGEIPTAVRDHNDWLAGGNSAPDDVIVFGEDHGWMTPELLAEFLREDLREAVDRQDSEFPVYVDEDTMPSVNHTLPGFDTVLVELDDAGNYIAIGEVRCELVSFAFAANPAWGNRPADDTAYGVEVVEWIEENYDAIAEYLGARGIELNDDSWGQEKITVTAIIAESGSGDEVSFRSAGATLGATRGVQLIQAGIAELGAGFTAAQ